MIVHEVLLKLSSLLHRVCFSAEDCAITDCVFDKEVHKWTQDLKPYYWRAPSGPWASCPVCVCRYDDVEGMILVWIDACLWAQLDIVLKCLFVCIGVKCCSPRHEQSVVPFKYLFANYFNSDCDVRSENMLPLKCPKHSSVLFLNQLVILRRWFMSLELSLVLKTSLHLVIPYFCISWR